MVKPIKQIAAGHFKATCLRLLDEVAADGQEYVVTKRGRPVARVIPVPQTPQKWTPPPSLKGTLVRFDRPNEPIFDAPTEWSDDPA